VSFNPSRVQPPKVGLTAAPNFSQDLVARVRTARSCHGKRRRCACVVRVRIGHEARASGIDAPRLCAWIGDAEVVANFFPLTVHFPTLALGRALEWTFHFLEVQLRVEDFPLLKEAPIENPLRSFEHAQSVLPDSARHDASTVEPW